MMRWIAPAALLLLASCPPMQREKAVALSAPDLETAAIARGLVRDPGDIDPTGLYARDTDRLCIVPDGGAYRTGIFIDYGDGIGCSASGTATRSGSALRITLGDKGCSFDARLEGDRVRVPGRLPDACAALCTSRASLSGLDVTRLSESVAEASAMRDMRGRLPCATR